MSKELPNIEFKSNYPKIKGIEIIRLEDLMLRKDDLNHSPEKAHQLDFHMLLFYTEGETKQLVDFIWHKARKNTLIHLAKGQINAFKFKKDVKGFMILFTEDYFKEQLNKLPKDAIIRLFTAHLFAPTVHVPEISNTSKYIKLLYDEYYTEYDFNKNNIIDSLYNIIFSKVEQLKKHQTFHIEESDKLVQFLKFKALLDKSFNLSRNADFYAKKLNITYKHLNVICKEVVDTTAKQFIDEFIILEAKRRLINSAIKSTELAFLMGFEESTNFVKYFKKFTGVTPNSFKKQYL